MALETYRQKRNFKTTPEPKGRKRNSAAAGQLFVVQKHAARRLHYDFRLEMDGVLKSWAVTRGPSLDPADKRLAVHVEDHPLDYGSFEGTIPKGEYGGGTVVLWDTGTWRPVGDPAKGYAKGHMEFELDGQKLHGRWHLVRMPRRTGDRHENWLLIKAEDAFARPGAGEDLLETQPDSVKTGRTMDQIAGEEPGWSSKTGPIKRAAAAKMPAWKAAKTKAAEPKAETPKRIKGGRQGAMPAFVEPCLATLTASAPKGNRWIHEIKFDGYRLQARLVEGKMSLLTRTGLDWTERFGPEIREAFEALPVGSALIDGEMVVERSNGASDFSALQADLSDGRHDRFRFYAFDLLYHDGVDLTGAKLVDRKAALEALIPKDHTLIRFSGQFDEDGDLILRHACRLSLEGVVSKLRDAPYRPGRNRDWLKSKCSHRQEFVIGGYVPSSVSGKAIGSLVMGLYEGKKLVHVGRVGTGYSAAVAASLFKTLEPLRTEQRPFGDKLTADEARDVRFVRPELVAEVEFRSWTADKHLRHAAFRGLREDKPATEVGREEPVAPAKPAAAATRPAVKLTHPDRVYWPDAGVTKEGLASYYADVWPFMGPFVVSRPLSLVRCPGGVTSACFFQKHAWNGIGKAIRQVPDSSDPDGERLLVIDDLAGALTLVQAGVLEIHPWGSTLAALEKPDLIIMDLDPGEGVSWGDVIAAAGEVRERLKAAGLAAFVKTSGGKGLHVVSPLKPTTEWAAVKAFTKGIADSMAADAPDRYVSTVTKAKRKNKILIDYLRNGRGATAVAPYSTRARPGASVSMPVDWSELSDALSPSAFTVANAMQRLSHLDHDPWADFLRAAVPIPEARPVRRLRR